MALRSLNLLQGNRNGLPGSQSRAERDYPKRELDANCVLGGFRVLSLEWKQRMRAELSSQRFSLYSLVRHELSLQLPTKNGQ